MPEAPRDRHWALNFSMVAFTVSIMSANEYLRRTELPVSFYSQPAWYRASNTTQPKNTPTTHLACLFPESVLPVELLREVCASCLE